MPGGAGCKERRSSKTGGGEDAFALAPVVAMRTALDIGLQGDRLIGQYFRRGATSKLHVNFETQEAQAPPLPEEREDLIRTVEEGVRGRRPLITFDAKSSYLSDSPQDRNAAELREFQVLEIARAYGIPPPVIGSMTTEWGQGIAELARYWWKFGLQDHLARYLWPFSLRMLPRGMRFRGNPVALLRGDAEAISKLLMATQGDAQRPAVLTWAERRDVAGFPYIGEEPPPSMESMSAMPTPPMGEESMPPANGKPPAANGQPMAR